MATFPEALHGASDDTLMPLSQSVDSPMPDASENDTITLLRNWIGEEYALCMLAAKRSSASLWKYLVNMNPPDPGNPLLVQIFVDGYLKPFHPLADQILFQKTEDDLFSYIATLWDDPDPEILPTVDLGNEMPRLLRDWLVHPSLVASALHLDIIVLRTFLERRSPPSEPLRSKIFFKDRLKLFTCPSRKQGEDDVFHHLAALWGPISEPIDSVQTRSKAQKERLFQSMESEFVGGAAAEFSEGMQCYKQLWEENRGLYYGRIVPITAPSGLGKTKMVLHHLASNPGIYICLRSPADSSAQVWPPGDRPITQFLQKYAHKPAAFVSAALLAALMDCARETYANDSSSGDVLSDHNLRWKHKPGSQLGKDHRAENLSKVAEQAEKLVLQKEVKFQEELQTASVGNSPTSLDRARAAVKVVCEESAKRLAEKAPGFIFVIDECTAIPHLYPARQVSPLLRVMESLSNHDLWFVLVSTSSKIISYAPSMDVMATQRFLNQMSMSPWFFLPFDTFLEDHAPLTTLGEHLTINELQVYGRPLWKAYTPDEVLAVARTKLLNVPGLVFSNKCLLEHHTFAVYSQRICLTLNPSQPAQLVEIAAVEWHMRLAKGFHAGMLITFCPSEPILALTAAMLINETPEYRKNATQSLVTLVSKYRVDRGLEGELYARLVLVMARDVATMCTSSSGPSGFIEETSRGPALRPVTLQSMLAALLKKSAVPAEYLGPLAKIGTDVYVTFTHFVEMHVETAVLDAKWCFDMLCRGTAAQCTFGQPVIDGIIFGYRGDLNQAFDETGIFLVCYRAKARGKAAAAELAASLTCPMIRYSDGRIVKPDHLVILIDMAATTHYQGQGQAFVQHSRRCASVPKGSENNWQGYCDTHGITETPGDFLGIRGLEAYEVLDGLDVARLYRSISPEGPLEARFGPPSRVQYNKLTTGTSRW
ncbi:hypothetical protein DFH09DRAFT_1489569 [Mycena vulgaris]|nr:hypothetical protein DFH09DRAFT_1489569 [Mycena vulgaris]